MPSAPDRRPSRAAVGCASPRSTLPIIARETPERSARALTESSRASRAACNVAARDAESKSDMRVTIEAVGATIVAVSGGSPNVRDASERDAEACAVIYAPYVTDTAITFESDPPLPAEMAQRIATAGRTHGWVVLESEGRVVGYAYAGPFSSRAAYRWSCEVSVYLERGFRTAVAGTTLPNDASVGLHRAMGFEPVGTYRRIGWKHDTWHDVAWAQRTIATGQDPPAEPR